MKKGELLSRGDDPAMLSKDWEKDGRGKTLRSEITH
jgi:hypothetical protein